MSKPGNPKPKQECPKCQVMISKSCFDRHVRSCDGSGPYRPLVKNHEYGFMCEKCSRIFKKASGLGLHNCDTILDRRHPNSLDVLAWGDFSMVFRKICPKSQLVFYSKNRSEKYHPSIKLSLRTYLARAGFKFNVFDYPTKFDISLIEQHGWYSPGGKFGRNKNTNFTGVSRDHLYSVQEGWINDVDPEILGHPANCQIILQSENISKGNRSSISLDDLLHRIKNW